MLRDELGPVSPSKHVPLEAVSLPEARPLPDSVRGCVESSAVHGDHEQRLRHAAGRSYPDLVRLRAGRPGGAPDAVITPRDGEQVACLLEACAQDGVAVVPFGGGTSVVGGVEPLSGAHDRIVSLDLRLLRDVEVDPVSMTARLGPGLLGPEAETALRARGFTLGHFPQSFEYASVGGFAATRSAGQASSGYGRFDELVTSVSLIAPAGRLRTLATPHTAAGPALRELVLGSEGALGVIDEVGVRLRPAPAERRYEAWVAPRFTAGCELARALAQAGALPDVIRLSDEDETRVSLGLSGTSGAKRALLEGYLRLRRRSGGCIVICGWEGAPEALGARRALSARILRSCGAVPLGAGAGRAWERGRYEGPYLRDELLDLGYMVDTLETSHAWSQLEGLYRVVREALADSMKEGRTPGLVMCHLSHAYRDGASLYFTFIAPRRPGEELEQWRAVKAAACEAIVAARATITHHHAVGTDHAPYLPAEIGDLGMEALGALKQRLDPAGVMNPGKLLSG